MVNWSWNSKLLYYRHCDDCNGLHTKVLLQRLLFLHGCKMKHVRGHTQSKKQSCGAVRVLVQGPVQHIDNNSSGQPVYCEGLAKGTSGLSSVRL